ncbi:hypothetical protein PRIPAC_80277 [Pristionchus pacificus]|uniref:Uncharacterized protein n=1 Tax=Pristionchus pacificus TaxID=54126 RepID=A0A2A6BXB0_PRIPA|nr:hypothetical protein PRIPAC_80277 [Pristionchus pacificus]|eukprot:PDM70393.1 hypothetical protein PRIPAC_46639 [Pristionchus pacificus]
MIDVLLALAGLLGVSLVALSCCGPPGSSKVSFNGSSHDRVDTALDRGGSRKITVIEKENINHDVKEKSLEDERKKTRERINRSRTAKSNNRSNQEQLPRRRKARDDRDGSEKPSDKGGGGGRVRRKATRAEKDPLRPVSSSDPFSKQGSDATRVDRENDGDEASTKEAGTVNGSKTPMDDSQKGGSRVVGLPSTERVGTNETMVSRERADELESSKLKKEREAKTPAMQSNETQIDSDSKKASLKTPPKPKRRLTKRKEEEVRQWNEAIARGNVYRPRKDDETVDEVHVDWNG